MKKVSLALAAVLSAAIIAVPLAACDDGSAFKLENYALPLSAYSNTVGDETPYTVVAEQEYEIEQISSSSSIVLQKGIDENQDKYRLYDLKNDFAIADGKWHNSITMKQAGSAAIGVLSDGGTSCTICSADGTVLAEGVYSPSITFGTATISVGGISTDVYSLSYTTGTIADAFQRYFVYNYNLQGVPVFQEVTRDGSGAAGTQLGLAKRNIIALNSRKITDYPDYIYRDYSYTLVSGSSSSYLGRPAASSYEFYNGEKKTGSVSIANGFSIGVLGKYFYYYEVEEMSSQATGGYNYEINSSYTTAKMNYTLMRYDFVNGKGGELSCDYVPGPSGVSTPFYALYNQKTNDFDMVHVTNAIKKVNGVAVYSSSPKMASLIVDENAKPVIDITAKGLKSTFYKLDENHYLSGQYIFDNNVNILADFSQFSGCSVWAGAKMIVLRSSYGEVLIDYDGKILIPEHASSNKTFFADAYVTSSGNFIYDAQNIHGRSLSEVVSTSSGDSLAIKNNRVIEKKSANAYAIYTLGGKSLLSLSEAVNTAEYTPCGDVLFVKLTLASGVKYYAVR